MWARVEHNKVVELTDTDPSGRYHPSLIWYECPDDAKQGWIFDGEVIRDYTEEEKLLILADRVRARRDSKLAKWLTIRDIARDKLELSIDYEYDLKEVLERIEELRNVPQQEGFPTTVNWPKELTNESK